MGTDKASETLLNAGTAAGLRVRLLFCLGLICWGTTPDQLPTYSSADTPITADELCDPINPNSDPWWRLAALPNIGMVKAKRIVKMREGAGGQPHFTRPEDLAWVHGVGPKTIERIAPLLSFDEKMPEPPSTLAAIRDTAQPAPANPREPLAHLSPG